MRGGKLLVSRYFKKMVKCERGSFALFSIMLMVAFLALFLVVGDTVVDTNKKNTIDHLVDNAASAAVTCISWKKQAEGYIEFVLDEFDKEDSTSTMTVQEAIEKVLGSFYDDVDVKFYAFGDSAISGSVDNSFIISEYPSYDKSTNEYILSSKTIKMYNPGIVLIVKYRVTGLWSNDSIDLYKIAVSECKLG